MKATLTMIKPLGLMIASVAAVSATAVGITLASSAKADFALTASPTTASVTQGQTATYTITEQASNGFSGAVALSVSGLPTGAAASFGSNPIVKGATTSTLAITTAANTTTGPTSVTVTGVSGTTSHSIAVTLNVTSPPPATFGVQASPSSRSMLPGDSAQYTVTVSRQGYSGAIALTVAGLPANTTAVFNPASITTGTTSSLTVSTKNNTPAGLYNLVINAAGGGENHSAGVSLSIASSGKSFAIGLATAIDDLTPGVSRPMNLSFTNSNSQPLSITNMTVSLQSVTKSPNAPADKPCGLSDYSVTQFSGSYGPVVVPANGQPTSLSSLVADSSKWPAVTMNDPSNANQDGCKGARLTFAFTGAGQG